jgi:rsbT co-antagonist protein RsbR
VTTGAGKVLGEVLEADQSAILQQWIETQLRTRSMRSELLSPQALQDQASRFLTAFIEAVRSGGLDAGGPQFAALRQQLEDMSMERARQGYTPNETATFVFSLKQPVFARLRERYRSDPAALAETTWDATVVLDALGLHTMEAFQRVREKIIVQQQEEMLELSTPVITLWKGVLALPLIGTLDSARTQVVMESLLQRIVDTGAPLAIIDITGVPTVDTLTAQHLLKTVAAARLMGADCIISGIRPQIAQTIVHLGVELSDVVTKASLADAFAVALKRSGLSVQPIREGGRAAAPRQSGAAPQPVED